MLRQLPNEIYQEMSLYLVSKPRDLVALGIASTQDHLLVKETLELRALEIINSLPSHNIMKFIESYRSTNAFNELTQKFKKHANEMKHNETILYTLITNDIKDINSEQLHQAITFYREQNHNGRIISDDLLKGLEITLSAIKYGLLKKYNEAVWAKASERCKVKRGFDAYGIAIYLTSVLLEKDKVFASIVKECSISKYNTLPLDKDKYGLARFAAGKYGLSVSMNLIIDGIASLQTPTYCNLSGSELKCYGMQTLNLSCFNLENSFLRGGFKNSILINTNLKNSKFFCADLSGAIFGRNIQAAHFDDDCQFVRICISEAYLATASFTNRFHYLKEYYKTASQADKDYINKFMATACVKAIETEISRLQKNSHDKVKPIKNAFIALDILKSQPIFNEGFIDEGFLAQYVPKTILLPLYSMFGYSTNEEKPINPGKAILEAYENDLKELLKTLEMNRKFGAD